MTEKIQIKIILPASLLALSLGLGGGYMLSIDTETEAAAGVRNICDIPRPQYCEPCGAPGAPTCPQAGGNWLCCDPDNGVCIVALGSCPAGHDFGWCDDVTVNEAGRATCHDGD